MAKENVPMVDELRWPRERQGERAPLGLLVLDVWSLLAMHLFGADMQLRQPNIAMLYQLRNHITVIHSSIWHEAPSQLTTTSSCYYDTRYEPTDKGVNLDKKWGVAGEGSPADIPENDESEIG